jgi:hypothetical protein
MTAQTLLNLTYHHKGLVERCWHLRRRAEEACVTARRARDDAQATVAFSRQTRGEFRNGFLRTLLFLIAMALLVFVLSN